jgi:hypothetical protein
VRAWDRGGYFAWGKTINGSAVEARMSDDLMRFIPTEPSHVPSDDAQARAIALLRDFTPRADGIKAQISQGVEFIDCGANWSGVACPACGADLEGWFWDELERVRKSSAYRDLSVVTPCCSACSSLQELRFGWAVGFARFVLEVSNANVGGYLSLSQQRALEEVLGCQLRLILCHI